MALPATVARGSGRRLGPAGGCFPHVPPASHRRWAPPTPSLRPPEGHPCVPKQRCPGTGRVTLPGVHAAQRPSTPVTATAMGTRRRGRWLLPGGRLPRATPAVPKPQPPARLVRSGPQLTVQKAGPRMWGARRAQGPGSREVTGRRPWALGPWPKPRARKPCWRLLCRVTLASVALGHF